MTKNPNPVPVTVTIANGAATSSAARLVEATLLGLIFPAALTNTSFTFTVSMDGATYVPLYSDDGTAYTLTVSTSRAVALDYTKFVGWNYAKLVGAGNEGGARTITLAVRVLS